MMVVLIFCIIITYYTELCLLTSPQGNYTSNILFLSFHAIQLLRILHWVSKLQGKDNFIIKISLKTADTHNIQKHISNTTLKKSEIK